MTPRRAPTLSVSPCHSTKTIPRGMAAGGSGIAGEAAHAPIAWLAPA